ncbi:MAG: D-alanyl-D-alanine carboxypeptidase family protein, partial [Methylococcales bacterium]
MRNNSTFRSGYSLYKQILNGVFVVLAMFGFCSAANGYYSSIVIDAESGRVLHENNADTLNYPASLTKMMTLYLVFSALESNRITLDTRWVVSPNAARQPPTKLGLKAGRTITVRDCILALVTKSANDMAVVVAEGMAGSEYRFAAMMTEKSRDLNMWQTTFRNASGLPDIEQMTTARDIARLALALLRDFPNYYGFFSAREFRYGNHVYRNHNGLLKSYPGTDGIKTGFIRASGYNLAASSVRNGRRLIGVVLGGISSRDRNEQMMSLLDQGFAMLEANEYPLDGRIVELERESDFGSGVSRFELERLAFGSRLSAFEAQDPRARRKFAKFETLPFTSDGAKVKREYAKMDRKGPVVHRGFSGFKYKSSGSMRYSTDNKTRSTARANDRRIEKRVGIPKYSKPVAKRESRGWSIQVGAFTSYKPAKSAASRA